jgi:hypothetical protein
MKKVKVIEKLSDSLADVQQRIEEMRVLEEKEGLDKYGKSVLFCLKHREALIKEDIDRLENPEKYSKERP